MKKLLSALTLVLTGCSGLSFEGAVGTAVPIISEHISSQLVVAAYAKCTSEINAAVEKGVVNKQKVQQAEYLLGAMETALTNRELVGALRLEVEKVCGEIDTRDVGDTLANMRELFESAVDSTKNRPE